PAVDLIPGCAPPRLPRRLCRPRHDVRTLHQASISLSAACRDGVSGRRFYVSVLVDAIPGALPVPVPDDGVLERRPSHPDGAIDQALLAHDAVLAAVLVRQPGVHARLAGAPLDRARLDLELLESVELPAVPQAADTDVELVSQVDAHGVEPEIGSE